VSLNLGLSRARGDVVVRVDGHCEIARDYVRRCVGALVRHDAWCVGGPMHTVGTGTVGRAIALAQSCRFGVGSAAFRTGSPRPRQVDTLAFGAYWRSVFEEIGGFDEELVRNQDDELNVRLTQAGGSIWLDPEIRSVYHSRSSLGGLWRQYCQYGFYKVRVIQKRAGVRTGRQLVPPLFVAVLGGATVASVLSRRMVPVAVVAGPYVAANLGASLMTADGDHRVVPPLAVALAAMHVSYGMGFLAGVWRWRSGFGVASGLRMIRPGASDG
jgi:hypothetical protein